MKESESEVLKIEESESEFLCTDSTALAITTSITQTGRRTKPNVKNDPFQGQVHLNDT
jgi:hypothetical protein